MHNESVHHLQHITKHSNTLRSLKHQYQCQSLQHSIYDMTGHLVTPNCFAVFPVQPLQIWQVTTVRTVCLGWSKSKIELVPVIREICPRGRCWNCWSKKVREHFMAHCVMNGLWRHRQSALQSYQSPRYELHVWLKYYKWSDTHSCSVLKQFMTPFHFIVLSGKVCLV